MKKYVANRLSSKGRTDDSSVAQAVVTPMPRELTKIIQDTTIVGEIHSDSNLQIEGKIKGQVHTTGDIIITGKLLGKPVRRGYDMTGSAIQGMLWQASM